jgi:hypothetical protein
MYGMMTVLEMGFSLVLFVAAWLAGRKASRLRYSGSAERLHRKTRKLLFRTGWLTLPALIVFSSIIWMIASLPSLFWEDRLLLNAPLIGAPLLAVWFTTVPMLWGLWKHTEHTRGPLQSPMKRRLRSRLFIMPYQATALGAVTTFYFGLVSPVPYDPLKVETPILVYIILMTALWMHHDRRFSQMREWLRSKRRRQMAAGTQKTKSRM